jgi:peptidoglycan/LPS O-acetylase OafA/YrhL
MQFASLGFYRILCLPESMAILKKIDAIAPSVGYMGAANAVQALSPPGRRRLPALDGLRGTAILAVLTCHYSALLPRTHGLAGFLEGGWIGVDLFFVLSGFLITGILFDARGMPHYFRNFYARRILRIFPLYYAFLLLLIVVLSTVPPTFLARIGSGSNPDSQLLWNAQPWLWTHTGNYWMAMQGTWTAWTEMIMPLWSLSVEEQFYLLWPLVLFPFSHRGLIRICAGVMIGVLALRLLLTASGVNYFTLYVLTPTRADSLAAGALLALLIRLPDGERFVRKLSKYAGPAAGVLVLALSAGMDPIHHPWLRNFFYSALAVFFAVLLFWSIDPHLLFGIPKRFYENRVLRTIGGYSYGIYIVHLPLMYFSEAAASHWGLYDPKDATWSAALALIAFNAILAFSIALASFHLYEKQFLKMKRHFPENTGMASLGRG